MVKNIAKVMEYIEKSDIKSVEKTVSELPSSQRFDFELLLKSLQSNNIEIIDYFLKRLINTKYLKDSKHLSDVINISIKESESEVLDYILNKINDLDKTLYTNYLLTSIYTSKLEHTEILIKYGADINSFAERLGGQAVLLCYMGNNPTSIDFLHQKGVKVKNYVERTLGLLNENTDLATFEKLESYLEEKLSIKFYNENILKLPVLYNNLPILNYLLDKGCDIKKAIKYAKLDENKEMIDYLNIYALNNKLNKKLPNNNTFNIKKNKL